MKSQKFVIFCALFCLVVSTFILLKILLVDIYLDFTNYYLAVKVFTQGINPYMPNPNYFGFPYPPTALLLFLPFTFLPLVPASKLFIVITMICLIASLYLLLRIFRTSLLSLRGIILIILALNFFPVKFSLAMGQINTIILLLLVLFLYGFVKKRPYFAGGFLGSAIALKIYPFLLIPFLIIEKQWKLLAAMILTLIGIGGVILLTVPISYISFYLTTTLPAQLATGGGSYYFDQSLSGSLARVIENPDTAAYIARILAGVIVCTTLIIIWLKRRISEARLLCISILLIINLILNNFNWQHHFIWLIIPFFITFFYIYEHRLHISYYIFPAISYILVATNISTPANFSTILQSHVFYGGFLLYILNMILLLKMKSGKTKK